MNKSKKGDKYRWSGEFQFETHATFDLSKCVSTNSCKGQLLFTVLDHVSDLDQKLEVIDWHRFVEMAALKTSKATEFYNALWKDPVVHQDITKLWKEMCALIAKVDQLAVHNPRLKDQCNKIFSKV